MDSDRPSWDTLDEDALLEACSTLLRRTAARLGNGASDLATLAEARDAMSIAQERLPAQKLEALRSELERAQNHLSLWLFYHDLRIKPDLAWEGPTGINNTATAQEKALAEQISKTMKRAYWDGVLADLDGDPPKFEFVMDRLRELTETMVGFVPAAQRDAKRAEAIDIVEVTQLIEHQALDWHAFLGIIQRMMQVLVRLESAHESGKTERWFADLQAMVPPGDAPAFNRHIVDTLAYLFEKCDTLRVGFENFKLRCVQVEEKRDLERCQFAQLLDAGTIDFKATERWLQASGDPHVEVAFYRGFARLLQEKSALTQESCPEALRCDVKQLQSFQSSLQGVALIGLVAITIHELLPPTAGMVDVETLLDRVWKHVMGPRPSMDEMKGVIGDQLSEIRRHANLLPPDASELDRAFSRLDGCLKVGAGSGVSPIFDLLHKRVLAAVAFGIGPPRQALLRDSLGESPWSLHVAVKRLEEVVREIWDFASDHLAVYMPMYQLALDEAVASDANHSSVAS